MVVHHNHVDCLVTRYNFSEAVPPESRFVMGWSQEAQWWFPLFWGDTYVCNVQTPNSTLASTTSKLRDWKDRWPPSTVDGWTWESEPRVVTRTKDVFDQYGSQV